MAGSQPGKVSTLIFRDSDGVVYFFMTGPAFQKPACATSCYWVIRDDNSTSGKRTVALLMEAFATGATIAVGGTNVCSRWYDGETVDSVLMTNGL